MSNNNLHVHNVSRVTVDTETVGLDSGNGYTVHRVDIHSVDHSGKAEVLRVTLYGIIGEQGIPAVPFEFSKTDEEKDEPPPAIRLAMERDLDGAVAMGKVWGEVFDNLFAPKR